MPEAAQSLHSGLRGVQTPSVAGRGAGANKQKGRLIYGRPKSVHREVISMSRSIRVINRQCFTNKLN